MIRLELPDMTREEQEMNYRREFIGCCDEDPVVGDLVPTTTLFAIRELDDYLVGMVDIRHELNDYLYNYSGHIGYSIRKSERRKGYATQLLKLSLVKCKELGLDQVLLCCYKNNVASAKIIISNGGELENEVIEDGKVIQRYWIQC